MKTTRRILSMLLCLALVLGFVPALTMPAQAASGKFVKVTTAPSDWSGTYLIVYEDGNVAFNGALSTLDAVSNTVAVTISNGEIAATDTLMGATFTIEAVSGGYSIKSASGKYIGRSATSNGLNTADSYGANYVNTITLNSDGTVKIAGKGGPALQYNADNNQWRFRYFKSTQKAICLYKFVENTCVHDAWVWDVDTTGHHKVCQNSECGEKFFTCTKAITYTTTETQHTPECDCGYAGTAGNHEFGDYLVGAEGHYKQCEVCEYETETEACVNDGTGKCGTCGTTMGCSHDWQDAYNETQHYQVCSKCGDTQEEAKHELTATADGDETHTSACDCGYSVTEKHVLTNGKCSCGFALKAEATGGYVKITSADQLVTGKYILVNTKGYAPGVLDDDWVTAVQPTVSGDVCTDPKGAVWTLTVDGSSVILTDSKGVSIAPPGGDKNGIKSGAYKWAWEFADDKFTFSGTGEDTVKLASNVGSSNQFRAYKNSTTNSNSGSYPTTFTLYKYVENNTEVNVFQADTRLKDTLNLAFHFTVNGTDEVVKAGALITIGDKTYNYIATEGKGYYSVEVSGIYAQSIDTKVYIKPYAELATGLVYGEQKSTSVLGCLEYMYRNPDESDATKLVIKDLLNYANAARNYFVAKGTMEAPAQAFNNILAEADRVLVWNDEYRAGVAEVEETTGAFEPVDGKIIAGIQEALRLRVEFEDSNVAGFVYWNEKDYADNSGNHTVDTGTKTFVMDGGVAKGYIENIYAYEMYEDFFIRAYNAEGELSETYTRSIAAYITIEMDKHADDEAYVELCKAMLIYGNTAMKSDAIVKGQ